MKFKLTPTLKIVLLLLVACLAYLYFTGAFEGFTGTAISFNQLNPNEEISASGRPQTKNSSGKWITASTGALPGNKADRKQMCLDTSGFSWITSSAGGLFDDKAKICGDPTTFTTDNNPIIQSALGVAGTLHCITDSNKNALCHSDNAPKGDNGPDANSYKYYYKIAYK